MISHSERLIKNLRQVRSSVMARRKIIQLEVVDEMEERRGKEKKERDEVVVDHRLVVLRLREMEVVRILINLRSLTRSKRKTVLKYKV